MEYQPEYLYTATYYVMIIFLFVFKYDPEQPHTH